MNINISLRANDLEFIGNIIAGREVFELSYDEIKSKFRVQNPPNGTTQVPIIVPDTEMMKLYDELRTSYQAQISNTVSRLKAVLVAAGSAALVTEITRLDDIDTATIQTIRQQGRRKLTRA